MSASFTQTGFRVEGFEHLSTQYGHLLFGPLLRRQWRTRVLLILGTAGLGKMHRNPVVRQLVFVRLRTRRHARASPQLFPNHWLFSRETLTIGETGEMYRGSGGSVALRSMQANACFLLHDLTTLSLRVKEYHCGNCSRERCQNVSTGME
jgi:hypothetical protein